MAEVVPDIVPTTAAGNDDLAIRLAETEREAHTLRDQLQESTIRADTLSRDNNDLRSQIQKLENEVHEKNLAFSTTQKEREQLSIDRCKYINANGTLKSQKDILEAQAARLADEKRLLVEDVKSLKDRLSRSESRIAVLQSEIDDFQSTKAMVEADKDRWNQEKEIYLRSREWYMKELGERDSRISNLRMQIASEKVSTVTEKNSLTDKITDLTLQLETVNATLQEQERELAEYRKRVSDFVAEKESAAATFHDELSVKDDLAEAYKSEVERLTSDVERFVAEQKKLQIVVDEKNTEIEEIRSSAQSAAQDAALQAETQVAKIRELEAELEKANELLQFGCRDGNASLRASGVGGGDFSSLMSPGAAAAANLITNGESLTAIYAKHAKVVGELYEEQNNRKALEKHVSEIVEEFRKNAPNVVLLKEENDCLNQENDLLRHQLQDVITERDQFLVRRRDAERELAFTKTEHLKAQRENEHLTKQVQKLLFTIQRNNDDDRDDKTLFTNLQELHKRNLDLLSEVDELRESQSRIHESARAEAIQAFEEELQNVKEELESSKFVIQKQKTIIDELERQRDSYKSELEIAKQRSPVKNLSSGGRISFAGGDATSDTLEWQEKYDSLQDRFAQLSDNKQKTEDALQKRIDSQKALIATLQEEKGRLSSNAEFHKENNALAVKRLANAEKEVVKKAEEAAKYKASYDAANDRIAQLMGEIATKQEELTDTKVKLEFANDELYRIKSDYNRLDIELDVLRKSRYENERMNIVMNNVSDVLKLYGDGRLEKLKDQLEAAKVERDEFQRIIEDTRSQAERRYLELQATLGETQAQKEKAVSDLRYQQDNFKQLETLLASLRETNASLQKRLDQAGAGDSSSYDALNKEVQQMRNKNLFLEKQQSDARMQIDQLNASLEAKNKQFAELEGIMGGLESTVKTQDHEHVALVARLRSDIEAAEVQLTATKNALTDVSARLEVTEKQNADHAAVLDAKKQEHESQITALETTVRELTQQLAAKTNEAEEAAKQLANLEAEREGHVAKMRVVDGQLVAAENTIASLKVELQQAAEKHEQQIIEHGAAIGKLRETILNLEREKVKLTEEISETKAENGEQKRLCNELLDRIQSLAHNTSIGGGPTGTGSANVSFAGDDVALGLNTSTSTADAADHSDASFNAIIRVLRKTNEREMKLRMAAEVEANRVKSQASIDDARINELTMENARLEHEVEKNAQLAAERVQLVSRLEVLQHAERKVTDLQHQLDQAKEHSDKYEKTISYYENQSYQMAGEKKELYDRITQSTAEIDRLQKQIQTLQQQLKDAQTRLATAPPTTASAQSAAPPTTAGSGDSGASAELAKQNEILKSELAKSKDQFNKLRNAARKVRDDLNAEKAKTKEFDAEMARLKVDNRELESIKIRMNGYKDEIESLKDNSPQQILTLRKKLHERVDEVAQKQKDIDELKTENEKLTAQLAEARAAAAPAEPAPAAVVAPLHSEAEIKELEVKAKQVEEYESRVTMLEKHMSTVQKRNDTYKIEFAALQKDLDLWKEKYESVQAAQKQMESELEAAKAAVAQATRKRPPSADEEGQPGDSKRFKPAQIQQQQNHPVIHYLDDPVPQQGVDAGIVGDDEQPQVPEAAIVMPPYDEQEQAEGDDDHVMQDVGESGDGYDEQEYVEGGNEESDSYPDPPNDIGSYQHHQQQQQQLEAGVFDLGNGGALPNPDGSSQQGNGQNVEEYDDDDDEEAAAGRQQVPIYDVEDDVTDDDGMEEGEDVDEEDDDDDDDEGDVHSDNPDEGEHYPANEQQDEDDDDDDDVVVLE